MGGSLTKSPLERRNTVARRSQRRTIHSIKARIDKVLQDIKKLKSIEEDVNYNSLKSEIEHIKNELHKKSRDLQPQVKTIYDNTLKRLDEAVKALAEKIVENQEKAKKKEKENQEKAEKKKEKKKKENTTPSDDEEVEVQEVEDDKPVEEATSLAQSTEKRKTVELKFVQIVPDETVTQVDIHDNNNTKTPKTPEDKRKSILKMGVPVMPGAMMSEISNRSHKISKQYDQQDYSEITDESIVENINNIIENLQAVEYQIADFVGKKHGTQYNRIRDHLNHYLIELTRFDTSDEYTLEQIKICKNYVGSCLNFLDEKALEDKPELEDDVFSENNNNSKVSSPIDPVSRLQRLSKTTAI